MILDDILDSKATPSIFDIAVFVVLALSWISMYLQNVFVFVVDELQVPYK